jgi:hypothetical protein
MGNGRQAIVKEQDNRALDSYPGRMQQLSVLGWA